MKRNTKHHELNPIAPNAFSLLEESCKKVGASQVYVVRERSTGEFVHYLASDLGLPILYATRELAQWGADRMDGGRGGFQVEEVPLFGG
jgi:hypothetical protein